MTDLGFNRQDVEGLAAKLAAIDPRLEEKERNLLLTIFSVAAEQVSGVSQVPTKEASAVPAELRDQLIDSFLPDGGDDFVLKEPPPPGRHGP
jgi:hypothetical protein